MRLASFIAPDTGRETAGEVNADSIVAFGDGSSVLAKLVSGDRTPARGATYALGEVELCAPYRPRAVFGIGYNYRAHSAETKVELPKEPTVFYKGPGSVASPNASVRTLGSALLDYEVELAVVIGVEGAVSGYAIANDVSARDWQRADPQWWRAKGADGFCPFGPWVTTQDEIGDPGDLTLRCWVNGELRQEASARDLVFPVEALIEHIEAFVRLEPGDVILTGTPAGIGVAMEPPKFLRPGDVVRMEITGLGAIENMITE